MSSASNPPPNTNVVGEPDWTDASFANPSTAGGTGGSGGGTGGSGGGGTVTLSSSSATRGQTSTITVTGTGFTSGTTVAISGPGTTVSGVTVTSSTSLSFNLSVSGTAPLGPQTITVTTGGSSATGSITIVSDGSQGNLHWPQLRVDQRNGAGIVGQSSDGTGTLGNYAIFGGDGHTITDSGVPVSSGATRQGWIAYDLGGKPPAGTLTRTAAGQATFIPIPGNLNSFEIPANFTGAQNLGCDANPTASAVYTFYKSGTSIGTLTIATSGVFTWVTSGGAAVFFNPGSDVLAWIPPATPDATLSGVRFAIPVLIS